jgi:hypothetical protein
MPSVKDLKPAARQHILWLHQVAFDLPKEEHPCIPCGGNCCRHCAASEGYLPHKHFERVKTEYSFDNRRGFLTDTGCALPVEERSITCLGFICSGAMANRPANWDEPPTFPFNVVSMDAAEQIRSLGWNKENWK